MKATTSFATLIAAGLLASTPSLAGPWSGNNDIQGSILNDLDRPTYMGTSQTKPKERFYFYGSFLGTDLDRSGYVVGRAAPEKGEGESYGWIVHDVTQFTR